MRPDDTGGKLEKLSQLLTLAMHCFLPSIPALPASRAVFWCVLNSSGTHDPAQNSGLSVPEYNTAENLTHPPESMIKIPMRKGYTTAKLRNVFFAYGLSLFERLKERKSSVNSYDENKLEDLWNWAVNYFAKAVRRKRNSSRSSENK
ncbi:hypothetical protein SS1G_11232 [Sclerotinia sclerotiorum 1980 UF-70]|uniref:Uncharacterized protein n=1 Tax=Sclerotinia sclerotiorum (strain ATCC 18683 / 1980 / Ss-1) TaxID=665079 RepID=A7F0W3_SCLS1|nr:hypothetical protein SS1G_11232 [Sclerotinia sclerotiorum 1980 UF-70]EDN95355.1 hypothetical protein SS1G_11232 [Sclerotinia sclerotiorum 1980 UF-70]